MHGDDDGRRGCLPVRVSLYVSVVIAALYPCPRGTSALKGGGGAALGSASRVGCPSLLPRGCCMHAHHHLCLLPFPPTHSLPGLQRPRAEPAQGTLDAVVVNRSLQSEQRGLTEPFSLFPSLPPPLPTRPLPPPTPTDDSSGGLGVRLDAGGQGGAR